MAASAKITVGSHVWVEDPDDAWIDGEVEEVNSDEITVNCSGKMVVTKENAVYHKDPEFPELGVDDMTKLAYLHEPGVLLNLKCRYNANEIYTYTGNILIAVNPFKRLAHLYGSETMKQYKGTTFGELSPHPFAVADSAYREIDSSRAIVIVPESREAPARGLPVEGLEDLRRLTAEAKGYSGEKSMMQTCIPVERPSESKTPLEETLHTRDIPKTKMSGDDREMM